MEEENYSVLSVSNNSRALASARDGAGYTVAYKQSEIRGEIDPFTGSSPLFVRPSLGVFKLIEESCSIRGLGALRIYHFEAPVDSKTFDPSILSEYVADAMNSENRNGGFNREGIRSLFNSAPERLAVKEELDGIIQTLSELEAINTGAYLYESNFEKHPDWRYRLVIPRAEDTERYGRIWVPNGQASHLIALDPPQSPLSQTHVYTNVLASKHRLFKPLGFEGFIDRDLLRIQRWQALQNQGRAA